MLIVDPMHNFFLGSATYFLKSILVSHDVISEGDFAVIRDCVDSVAVPSDIGCIPHKISGGYSSSTADRPVEELNSAQFTYCITRSLKYRHSEMLVSPCFGLCSKQTNKEQIMLGDALLLHFCRRTERIVWWQCITPNMHMHCHL